MSGHSKWSTIKRAKGAADTKRANLFTKLAREITVAARTGLPDPEANPRLRIAIQKARAENMPKDNIQRAIDRATGGADGANFDEITYEGYGPGGIAVIIDAMTDNKNRTVGEIRAAMTRSGGNLGESGSVSWMFDLVGLIVIPMDGKDEDELQMAAIEAGAQDVALEEGSLEIYTDPTELHTVASALAAAGHEATTTELIKKAKTPMQPDTDTAVKAIRLIEKLEDLDDVQTVYSNLEISDEVMAQVS
ncbi:MAG: YebC/PmpR family DNA-binding transcriptional regulator [Thermomicrobiales bacterium]|nr:YebC/PmpR family DNA-binding transcriptional regulator [Thermomicrobiales bacterium]MCO5217303.1 YebC/PmpR family DNA-binding transcriptional regulator [Thermomicrobiales bacterium]MCO5226331.1 YebC/PmpR family DNA-binding transcriptional regulator [Thermomicrobiales bacterium]MCO5228735.1 YebC/PmpR family DNA-binding transcriptional regulator [Thermomicrobiales bacterium]